MHICTIIAKNYVAHARVLAQSFLAHHPEGTCSVLIIDDTSGFIDAKAEPFEVLTIYDIGLPDAEQMAAYYDVMEFSTAVKPWLLRHLLNRPGVEAVGYMDPDIEVFAPLTEIDERAREHGVVLTPHFNKPLPRDGLKPAEEDILTAGSYNLGFIGLGAGETASELLDWWSERLERECLNEPEKGRFVDQRWIDLAPGLWPGVDVLRSPSFNIAYWNLATRRLEDDGAGGYLVDGEPLRFFHFSGFDPHQPGELSKHQNRVRVKSNPALARICGEYAEKLIGNGYLDATDWPYTWDATASGLRLDGAARFAFRELVKTGELQGSVFAPEGGEWFTGYLKENPPGDRNRDVNHYAWALWMARPDFRNIFPNLERDGGDYVRWLHVVAEDAGLVTELLPPQNGSGASVPLRPPRTVPGVNLVGYVSSERGVGEVARQIASALDSADVPLTTIDTPTEPGAITAGLKDLHDPDHPYDFNLICVNADMLPYVARALGPRFFERRRTAGLWFWEVSHFPQEWHPAFDHVNEVWVASEHIAETLRPLTTKPVQTMRVPIVPGVPDDASRAELGMPEDFCFLFIFDYRSVFRRKNPLGLVEAFCRAFEPGSGASLVIKSICGDEFPAERQALAEAVAGRPEIKLVEETITTGAKNAMIANCDCYVSLHRSEGLGLTMAEAMYFGKPVIATAYSGNLDFMTEGNSYLVPYEMTAIGPDADPYPPEQEWADPDLDAAATLMREVFEHPQLATQRGRRAAEDIRREHSIEATGRQIRRHIDEVKRHGLLDRMDNPDPVHAAKGGSGGRDQLEFLLNLPEPARQGVAGKLKGQAKRLYMRVLRPYAKRQRQIDVAVAESLDEVREVLRETVRMSVESDQAVQRLDAHMQGADQLVAAAAAEPYMADDRVGPQADPVLGATIGFRAADDGAGGYRGFEDLFRGSEEMVRDRQRVYLELVEGRAPVLDAGCGRGEFLDLLSSRGVAFEAVDLDPGMVERCREKGHSGVAQGDLVEYLERAEPGSLGTIFSSQVIEHLELAQLRRFLELGLSRLRPGGLLIAETVNPHSAAALKAFWVDPTHRHPLLPEAMLSLCALAGYAAGDVFAPAGSATWETDRTESGEYAVFAVVPSYGGAHAAPGAWPPIGGAQATAHAVRRPGGWRGRNTERWRGASWRGSRLR